MSDNASNGFAEKEFDLEEETRNFVEGELEARYEYRPGMYLAVKRHIPKYEKGAIQIAFWSNWISMAGILVLLVLTFADVFLRTFFNTGINGTYDFTRYIMVLVATFGMPLCAMNDEHVCIDVLTRLFPQKIQTALFWFNFVIVVIYLILQIVENWKQGMANSLTGQTDVGVPWPTYPFYYFIAIGFAAMLAIVFVKMINLARGIK